MTRQISTATSRTSAQAVAVSPLTSPLFRIGTGLAVGAVAYVLVMAPLAAAFAQIAA